MLREELIEIGYKIINWGEDDEKGLNELINLFNDNVPHPNGFNLMSYPENFNASRDDLSKYNPSVEEVVDKCLNYKPIILGGSSAS